MPKDEVCPNCGYCKHCGRGGYYPGPYLPWYQRPTGPTWSDRWTWTTDAAPTVTGTEFKPNTWEIKS